MWDKISFDNSGNHALVTGGANGIGYGIACAYREAGAKVTITGTRAGAADYDKDLQGFDYCQWEVTDKPQLAALADRLDILINNDGGYSLRG
jgi:NAD(P)-dependent dehydrogenase (short-subunit alcohol dehydrogenase family)